MNRKIARYGWRPDLPDQRDLPFKPEVAKYPSLVDLRPKMPPVVDQGQIGSCTANALAAAFEFELIRQNIPRFAPARLFIYYNERVIEGTVKSDSGAELRDGIKTLAQYGACSEQIWSYIDVNLFKKPPQKCYNYAKNNLATKYFSIDNSLLGNLQACLASGYPFVFGFTVYESFESDTVAQTGIVPLPAANEQVLGGHAVCAVGYDDSKQAFICRNSWGTSWGLEGYFYMPYSYLTNGNLASDFWTIRLLS